MFKYSLIISVRVFYEPTNIASTYSDKSLRAYIECQRRLNENSLKIYLSSVLNSGDVRRNEHTSSFKAKRFLDVLANLAHSWISNSTDYQFG